MSQYTSRINVRVSSPSIWNRFVDTDDAEFDLANLADTKCTSFVIDGEWSCFEGELEGIVEALSKTLKTEGIIIADTTNINVDPYNYCVYYFGGSVKTAYFGDYSSRCNMNWDTNIGDIAGWINYGKFSLTAKEKDQLLRCGVASYTSGSKVVFEEFSQTIEIEDKILLRNTGHDNRAEHIETINVLDEVVLFCAKATAEDSHLVEAFCKGKSIGYLPSGAGDELYPLIAAKRLDYEARIIKVVPLSKRNKHAKSPIVKIHIEAAKSYKPVDKNISFGNDAVQVEVGGDASDYACSLARSISELPDSIEFAGKVFVHTSCHQEKKIDALVVSRGGEVKSSTVMKTNYLIIGNDIEYETTKITRARELIEQGKEIIALTESEFWSLASENSGESHKEAEKPAQSKPKAEERAIDMSVWERYLSDEITAVSTSSFSGANVQSVRAKIEPQSSIESKSFGDETDDWQLYLAGITDRADAVNLDGLASQLLTSSTKERDVNHIQKDSAEEQRRIEAQKALDEKKRLEDEQKRLENERLLAEQKKKEEERRAEQERIDAEIKKKQEEEARILAEQKKAEEERQRAEQEKKRIEEEQRRIEEQKRLAEEQRLLEEQKRIAEEQRKELVYKTAMEKFASNDISVLNAALADLQSISGWGEVDKGISSFKEKIAYLLAEEKRLREEQRQKEMEQKRLEEQKRKEEMQRKWEEEERRRDEARKAEEQKRIEAENQRKNSIYLAALTKCNAEDIAILTQAIASFESISDWKDSKEQIKRCREKMNALIAAEELKQQEKLKAMRRENKLCQHCGGNLKGLFKKVCTQCGKPKDY